MNPILHDVVISLVTAAVLGLLSLGFRSVRTALFYNRVEYDFVCERTSGQSPFNWSWDVNWENYRLTFEADDISNDKIVGVTFEKYGGKTETIDKLFPSNSFRSLFDGEIQMKVNSIIRSEPASGPKVYTLRVVFRRRRFFLS